MQPPATTCAPPGPAATPGAAPAAAPAAEWLRGLDLLVLGLGHSGLAMARWCARAGAHVTVWDSRESPPQAAALGDAGRLVGGVLDGARAAEFQLVLKSPGLAPHDPRIAPLLAAARGRGVAVLGELDLFARALADLRTGCGYAPRLLAVTGTNGKTTTASMTARLVERAGQRVALAGNVGPTMLDTLASTLAQPQDDWPEVWVLELSSFQLEGGGDGAREFEPDAAAVLNLTQDHLDWHGTMDAYVAAKGRIFGARGTMVLNRDDARVAAMRPAPPVAAKGRKPPPPRTVLSFGLDAPAHPGDFGLVVESGIAWLARALPADETDRPRKGESTELHLQRLMPADAMRVRGRHNAANALAALALATAIGCPLAPMLHALREYRGEPHRVEPVGAVGGIEAFDDSKGTNVGATVAALEGLGADLAPARIAVILGGDGKGQDFAPLAAPVARFARAVALIGRDAPAVEAALQACGVPLQRHATLQDATAWCFAQARPGDAVLLSPACASLDMFRDYAQRAEVFVAAVQSLAAERGEVA
ncbi:MAG: UDP-N-acetylmuramoyl-L-alanine--D-glutamate ligase [Burkholderiales bacterium]|nr:UDP-N-acetylmuramoyl-L-alanine--D-glutamate ligase [Burkholderiales bacterium]